MLFTTPVHTVVVYKNHHPIAPSPQDRAKIALTRALATELADGTTISLDLNRAATIAAGFLTGTDKNTIIGGLLPGLLEAAIGLSTAGGGRLGK